MKYRMNDASLWIPDGWFEQTLHILSSDEPGKPGISLVVNAEMLDKKKDAKSYKDMALSRFPIELPGFSLLQEKEIPMLEGATKGWLLEHTWKAETGLMHHYQALCVYKRNTGIASEVNKGYSITMSMMEALHKPELEKTFKTIANSFKLERYGG
ncbi:MAG: DcrB-related protein [Chitinophagaceae bacterium]